MSFGWNLHRLRTIKQVSVLAVSSSIGVSEEQYISWENEEQEPWLDDLCCLAKYFKITIDGLVDENFDYKEYLHRLKAKGLM